MTLADRLQGRRVLIAGDVMLDRFLFGRVDRISPEAPVPVLRFEREERRLGGAANVAANIRALGGHPVVAGIVGADEWGQVLRDELASGGIESTLITDAARPTTCKVRLATSRNQQVARLDYESDVEIDASHADALLRACCGAMAGTSAVVISDYLKGAVTAAVLSKLVSEARARSIPVVADPKTPDPGRYRGATVITPNHHEAEAMARMRIRTDADAAAAARAIQQAAGVESVIITRGEHGMWLLDGSTARERALPATAREVSDVTGAGDTVVATLALGLAGGLSLFDAADLANRAAAIVVGKFGPATASLSEIGDGS